MLKAIKNIWFGLPIQLLLLQFKRFQILLIFWFVLFSTVCGGFMKSYGADALFLAPEYYNNVSAISIAIVGFSFAIFIMSWNITTFILNGHLVSFLATTAQPFLKYCINNAILPIIFLGVYSYKLIWFSNTQELMNSFQIASLLLGFFGGFFLSILIAFLYFFSADKTIYYTYKKSINDANTQYKQTENSAVVAHTQFIKVNWFLSARLKLRTPRNIIHYDQIFIKKVLSRQHFAAVIAISIAFIFLITLGLLIDNKLFQIPAAASIVIFFSLLTALIGAFSIFFKKWSLIAILVLYLLVNFLYKKEIIDPRNKAYGLNYMDKTNRPLYNEKSIDNLANMDNIDKDKENYLHILNNWKAKQKDSLPILYIINTSGGGLRSATFTMNVLQQLDSILQGKLMQQTLFITGASGGMLGATYFRELSLNKKNNLQSKQWVDNISTDLLNPIFSSFVSRDIIGPVQKFSYGNYEYIKDRGFAFEEKLNENTNKILNKKLGDYEPLEYDAKIPFALFNSTVTRDARKIIIASNPARFLMRPVFNSNITTCKIDAIDFASYFEKLGAKDLKILSALRMNATFPYALPNVWLPTNPIIDVMDAGIRDNYGTEITMRFLNVFSEWLNNNVSKIIVLQIRDRALNDWNKSTEDDDYISFLTKPFASMQHNLFKLQDYYQSSQISYLSNALNNKLQTICWQYLPEKKSETAGLSFHLTTFEKQNIAASVFLDDNKKAFEKLKTLINKK